MGEEYVDKLEKENSDMRNEIEVLKEKLQKAIGALEEINDITRKF